MITKIVISQGSIQVVRDKNTENYNSFTDMTHELLISCMNFIHSFSYEQLTVPPETKVYIRKE